LLNFPDAKYNFVCFLNFNPAVKSAHPYKILLTASNFTDL